MTIDRYTLVQDYSDRQVCAPFETVTGAKSVAEGIRKTNSELRGYRIFDELDQRIVKEWKR